MPTKAVSGVRRSWEGEGTELREAFAGGVDLGGLGRFDVMDSFEGDGDQEAIASSRGWWARKSLVPAPTAPPRPRRACRWVPGAGK